MALRLKNRVQETTTTAGTGTVTLSGAAPTGFQTFANALNDGDTTYYQITDGTDWEIGLGTFISATNELQRTEVFESTNSDAKVNWSAGGKDVFVVFPANKVHATDAYDAVTDLPLTGNVIGDQAYVTGNNRLYVWNGGGWYSIALVNLTPTITTQPDANYGLGTQGADLQVTVEATDPEGFPITWSANTVGMDGLATLSQAGNVFTFTPSADAGDQGQSFTATFIASDGTNTAVSNQATFTIGIDNLADPSVGTLTITSPTGQAVFISGLSELWKDVTLSIGTSSTNGADNSTFIDRSTNAHTVGLVGTPIQTAFHPYLDNWSVEFDGSSSYLESSYADLGSDDYTLEFWYRVNSVNTTNTITAGAGQYGPWLFYFNGSELTFYASANSGWDIASNQTVHTPALQTWYHIALVRDADVGYKIYVDGVQVVSISNTANISHTSQTLYVGIGYHIGSGTNGSVLDGSVSNYRLVVGSQIYTSAFTPPTEKLTAVSGTYLLACQSNRLKDESGYTGKYDISLATLTGEFSVTSQDPGPAGVTFSTDGTKMYITGFISDQVHQYNLSSPFSVSSASYVQSLSVSAQDSEAQNIVFSPDGTKMYIVGTQAPQDVTQYTLSTAFDISTATYTTAFSVNAQETFPYGLTFNNDGTKMYVAGATGDDVNQYDLSTPYDVSTASYSKVFSVSAQDTNPQSVLFSADGTLMFVLGGATNTIYSYNLSTAFDIATASLGNSFIVSGQETSSRGMALNNDGSKIYICGMAADKVFEYSMSADGRSISKTGNPKISSFNPLGQESEYVPGENKGSIEFENGNQVQPTGSIIDVGTGDFTIEFWSYGIPVSDAIVDTRVGTGNTTGALIQARATGYRYQSSNSLTSASGIDPSIKQWLHFAAVRDSGTVTIYHNGVGEQVTTGDTTNFTQTTVTVGANSGLGYDVAEGYCSDLRITKSAVYTANFTPPTAPVGNTNASLYLPFDNAGIFDKTGNATLVPNTSTATSTTQTKYADTSINFPTNSTLSVLYGSWMNISDQDFTMEMWVYPTDSSGGTLWSFGDSADNRLDFGWQGSGGIRLLIETSNVSNTVFTSSDAVSSYLNSWVHIAVVRVGTGFTLYVNGTSTATGTSSLSIVEDTTDGWIFGGREFSSDYTGGNPNDPFTGYLENIQFLKTAKYTTNFTPPTSTQGRMYQAES